MKFSFKNILVPADFTINTEVAVEKAIEIADKEGSAIHLLHLLHSFAHLASGQSALMEKPDQETASRMLRQWKEYIEERNPSFRAFTEIVSGMALKEAICHNAGAIGADLIVIGKNLPLNRLTFSSKMVTSELAERSGIPVLTVKPGSLHKPARTIVVPVGEELPQHKMDILAALSRNNRIRIHLVSFLNESNEPDNFSANSLLNVYQWLKNVLHCPVEYVVLHGNNKPKALLAYAEKIH